MLCLQSEVIVHDTSIYHPIRSCMEAFPSEKRKWKAVCHNHGEEWGVSCMCPSNRNLIAVGEPRRICQVSRKKCHAWCNHCNSVGRRPEFVTQFHRWGAKPSTAGRTAGRKQLEPHQDLTRSTKTACADTCKYHRSWNSMETTIPSKQR